MPKDHEIMTRQDRDNFMRATDADFMMPVIAARIENLIGETAKLDSFFITRVYPRKDGGFSIQYELNYDSSKKSKPKRFLLWGHLLTSSQPIPEYISIEKQNSFYLDDIRLAVPVFPYDPKLKHLGDYFGIGEETRRKLRSIPFLKDSDFEITECEVLGYRLERRCVLRYTLKISGDRHAGEKQFVARICRPAVLTKTLEISDLLANSGFGPNSDDGLTAAEVFTANQDDGVIFMESAPGESLHSAIGNTSFPDNCHKTGRILAKFHSIIMEHLPPYFVLNELDNLREMVDRAVGVFPNLNESFSAAFDNLNSHKPVSDHHLTCVHRDFYDKQILFSPKRTTLLDCDNAALSDAALDYGNFVAHLALRARQSPESAPLIRKGLAQFEKGYNITDKALKSRARWWKAASLLRLAALYSFRPRWRPAVGMLLDEANGTFTDSRVFNGERV